MLTRTCLLLATVGLVACADKIDPVTLIDAGACDATIRYTYTEHIAPLMQRGCTTCHASGASRRGAPGGVDFDTYAATRGSFRDGLRAIINGSMPPGGANIYSNEELCMMETWLSEDMPEN